MFNAESLKKAILNGDYNKTFEKLYPNSQNVAERYVRCVDKFVNKYGDSEGLRLFSAPGRTEVGGNHTDHQQGCVLAAGVDLDVIAVARKTDTGIIRIQSEGFAEDVIDLSVLTPQEDEVEHAPALVRGVAARFKQLGYEIGGFVGIDFDDTANPVIEKVDFDFKAVDHSLCIVDTGGCHADLTGDYAGVPAEMKAVAAYFGKGVLRDVDEDEFYSSIPKLRETVSDRAILRSIHFFNDNRRAVELKEKLKANDFDGFKKIISESGRSSLQCLQNVFAASNPSEQGLTLALTLTEKILNGKGAFRVHGGGFAGTIQAFVPNDILPEYKQKIEKVFGEGKCYVLSIRPVGGVEITPDLFD